MIMYAEIFKLNNLIEIVSLVGSFRFCLSIYLFKHLTYKIEEGIKS